MNNNNNNTLVDPIGSIEFFSLINNPKRLQEYRSRRRQLSYQITASDNETIIKTFLERELSKN